ncbi:MAG: FHA domain-containing protein [Chloroflexi bacterium]|nr:FHA domain-containing protein [Chloroflexota bacterium]
MNAWLETSTGVRIPLHAVCTIGRSSKNTLVLSDNAISRRHALIHAQGEGEHWLVDLGSSNGISLNGRRVKQPVHLKDQDRLEIVGNVLIFRQAQPVPDNLPQEKTTFLAHKELKTTSLWLVVADIEKSTQLSQTLSTDEFSQLIGGWFLSCKEIVEKHEGTMNKYLGDGFLAYWPQAGIPVATLAGLLGELKNRQAAATPPFRMAVHCGTVTVDKSVTEGEESLVGPEVSFVFRMERLAGKLEQACLLSEPAAVHLKSFGQVIPLGQHELSSFEGSYCFYRY